MLLPGKTVRGVPAVARARSAWMAVATTSVAVAELAPKAWFAALTVAVSVMIVPLAVPAVTLYTAVNIPLDPAATLGFVHCGGKTAQDQPAGGVIDTSVVLAGVDSLKVAPVAATEPVLVTTCV